MGICGTCIHNRTTLSSSSLLLLLFRFCSHSGFKIEFNAWKSIVLDAGYKKMRPVRPFKHSCPVKMRIIDLDSAQTQIDRRRDQKKHGDWAEVRGAEGRWKKCAHLYKSINRRFLLVSTTYYYSFELDIFIYRTFWCWNGLNALIDLLFSLRGWTQHTTHIGCGGVIRTYCFFDSLEKSTEYYYMELCVCTKSDTSS